jgi:hypothetical protein
VNSSHESTEFQDSGDSEDPVMKHPRSASRPHGARMSAQSALTCKGPEPAKGRGIDNDWSTRGRSGYAKGKGKADANADMDAEGDRYESQAYDDEDQDQEEDEYDELNIDDEPAPRKVSRKAKGKRKAADTKNRGKKSLRRNQFELRTRVSLLSSLLFVKSY